MALENAGAVRDGSDPRMKPQVAPTLAQEMEQAIEVLRPGWRGPRTEKQMRDLLEQYVFPYVGKR